jgi:hypothetical protein
MTSKDKPSAACAYIGVDITDRYAQSRRVIDVCGLEVCGSALVPHFWTWAWSTDAGKPVDVSALVPEMTAARAVLLDGPQGLARPGRTMRACERALGAAGKTSDVLPSIGQPYGGFVRSSLELFGALDTAGLVRTLDGSCRIHEVYPAAIWARLARGLPNKKRRSGRFARAAILRELGVRLPEMPLASHDRLDACAAALLGAIDDGRLAGVRAELVGDAVYRDERKRCLREGQILVPVISEERRGELQMVISPWELPRSRKSSVMAPPRARVALARSGATGGVRGVTLKGTSEERCDQLLDWLVAQLSAGHRTLYTYKAGVQAILGHATFSQGYGLQLTRLACRTSLYHIDSLGEVGLDTFIVKAKTRRPGVGHWKSATYTEGEWLRVFDGAMIVK